MPGDEAARARPEGGTVVIDVALDRIKINPYQPRKQFDPAKLSELSASLREHGVLQPLVVRQLSDGGYELVAGERRLRAAKMAGLERVPVIVRSMGGIDQAILSLVENLQREDLNCLEEAVGYKRLIEEHGLTQEELGQRLGRSQPAIANKLRLLKLDPPVQEMVRGGRLSETHARALLRLEDGRLAGKIAQRIAQEGLSVRRTEELVAETLEQISREIETAGGKGQRVLRVFKDVRIFLNTFRQAVKTLRDAGVRAQMSEADRGEFIEVTVRIPREQAGSASGKLRK
ncbi:MAG TPA: ParB/RepB/Spo0J family partition protein [Bacillota bacterium]|jgi:ParB family chromosome partitioning protein